MTSRFWGASSSGLLYPMTPGAVPYSTYVMALPFATGAADGYWVGGVKYATVNLLPGYSYARTGPESFVNGSGGIDNFLANAVPIATGKGYEAYGALTNPVLQSQAFDNATWIKAGAASVTTGVTAPDGTSTADKLTMTGGVSVLQQVIVSTANAIYSGSLFVRKPASGGANAIRFTTNNNNAWNTGISQKIFLTSVWQRLVAVGAFSTGTSAQINIGNIDAAAVVDADCVGDVEIWQAQAFLANFPDGGPIIATTTLAASTGAPTFSVSVPNGTYSAVYTFSDASTQTIPTTIAGGSFSMPTYPATLNLPIVAKVTLK